MRIAWLIPLLLAAPSLAQLPDPKEKEDPIPPAVALEATAQAYSTRPIADEVTLKFRSPGSGDRTDTFVIRIQPGPTPRSGPTRMFLDLGALKIICEGGKATAINTNAPGKYAQVDYTGAIRPTSLAGFLPPIPLPQLAFACGDESAFRLPTPYTPDTSWTLVTADLSTRPPTATISGSGPSGQVSLVTNAETGRIMRLTATIRGHSGDSTLDLSSRPIDPGDPAGWAFKTEGRERVPSIAALRPTAARRDANSVPDLQCTRADSSLWGLRTAVADAQAPLVVILFHRSGTEQDQAIERDSKAALAAVMAAHDAPDTPKFRAVAAAAIDTGPSAKERWQAARKSWERNPPPVPTFPAADELMWAPGGGTFIDRFAPGAKAILVVIAPDHSLRAAINLDGRSQEAISADFLAALKPPNKDAAPEAPR